jgi:Ca-activated chloride channel family protein
MFPFYIFSILIIKKRGNNVDNNLYANRGKSKSGLLLKDVNVNGYICGDFAEFSISQLYENREDGNIDAIYTFPLPDTAVITGFEATLGGRTLKAIIEEKGEAIRLYDEAVEKGINTFTLEQYGEDIFQLTIGNILPRESVKIKISYMDQLIYEDNSYKLIIPSVEAAKFIGEAYESDNEAEAYYKLYMNLFVESMERMEFISHTHKINVEREDDTLSKITLKNKNERLDSDFILLLREINPEEASGMSYRYHDENGEKGILYLRLFPKLEVEDNNISQNYDFLIDISKSMEGYKVEDEKNALQLCLRSLSYEDSFNIIAFGKELKIFSMDGKVRYNDENLAKATEWIDSLTMERGADIYKALKFALNEVNNEGGSRIILFTDDDVDENEEEILNYVKENIGDNRIFPIGIDTSVNSYFINKLAEYGYGKAEFIYPDEKIDDMVLRQFNRITNPQVDVTRIDWGNMIVETTYPRTIEYLYDREPFSIFAKVKGEIGGKISIIGKVEEEEYIITVDTDNLDLEENASLIQKVWARKRIESIAEKMRRERGFIAEAMRNKIVEISKESGIISPETTIIMLEQMEEPVLGLSINHITPIKISEEVMKEISEGYFLDAPVYFTKSGLREKMAEIQSDKNTALDIIKYDTENMLRILARSQNADGAFTNIDTAKEYSRIDITAAVLLAFALSKEDINIYVNQLNKAILYLIRNLEENEALYDEKLHVVTLLALESFKNKGIIKKSIKQKVDEIKSLLHLKVKEKKYIAIENVISYGNIDYIRNYSAFIYGISKNYSVQDKEILSGDLRKVVDKIAYLIISKTL